MSARPQTVTGTAGTLALLESLTRRLPDALAILARPTHGHPGIAVPDEHALQRIVHAMLCLLFADVREEEYGPSHAGTRPRYAFLSSRRSP